MIYPDCHYRTEGTVKSSSARDLEAMKQVFFHYQYDWSVRYIVDPDWEQVSEEEARFSADGPFGANFLDDVNIFRDMAAAAPEARMEGSIRDLYPYNSYTCVKEKLHCLLEDGVLATEITTATRDSEEYRYEDYIVEKLPYRKYTELFAVEPGSLQEEDYRNFIGCLTTHCWESPLDLSFEEFSGLLARYRGKTGLTWDKYEDACKKAEDDGLVTVCEFMDGISTTETEIRRFDARTRQDIP